MINLSALNDIGENIYHFGGVRIRVTGAGNLIFTFQSLDDLKTQQLTPLVMSQTPDREPFKLANFKAQRAFLRIETRNLDEIFRINRVIIFAKEMWSQFPNG